MPQKRKFAIGTIERTIGASKGVLSRALTQGTDIQSKWIEKIVENYPQIYLSWLLTGEGAMLKTAPTSAIDSMNDGEIPSYTTNSNPSIPIAHRVNQGGIFLILVDAMAGFANGNDAAILDYECEYYVIPMFRDAEFLIMVKGASKIPIYNSGDLVACKNLLLYDIFFQWNHIYVLSTDQGVLIK